MPRSVTVLGSAECFSDMAAVLDGLEQAFGITIRRIAVSQDRLPKDAVAQADLGLCVFGEDPGPLFRNILSKSASSHDLAALSYVCCFYF